MKQQLTITLLSTALYCLPSQALEQSAIEIGDRTIQVELAFSKEEHRQGLMGRQSLPPNSGMLFVYPQPQELSFWMKDTLMSLDILFFSADGVLQQIINNAPPCSRSPCITYKNSHPSQYVLELPGGTAKQWAITPGVSFDFVD